MLSFVLIILPLYLMPKVYLSTQLEFCTKFNYLINKSDTEVFPLVPVTAIIFFGFDLKNFEHISLNKNLTSGVLIINILLFENL